MNKKLNSLIEVHIKTPIKIKSNHRRRSVRKGILRNFAKFVTLLKKRLWHRCFSVNFAKFLTPFLHLLATASKNVLCQSVVIIMKSCRNNNKYETRWF